MINDDIIAAYSENRASQEYYVLLESRCNGWGKCEDIGYLPVIETVEALIPALNLRDGILL